MSITLNYNNLGTADSGNPEVTITRDGGTPTTTEDLSSVDTTTGDFNLTNTRLSKRVTWLKLVETGTPTYISDTQTRFSNYHPSCGYNKHSSSSYEDVTANADSSSFSVPYTRPLPDWYTDHAKNTINNNSKENWWGHSMNLEDLLNMDFNSGQPTDSTGWDVHFTSPYNSKFEDREVAVISHHPELGSIDPYWIAFKCVLGTSKAAFNAYDYMLGPTTIHNGRTSVEVAYSDFVHGRPIANSPFHDFDWKECFDGKRLKNEYIASFIRRFRNPDSSIVREVWDSSTTTYHEYLEHKTSPEARAYVWGKYYSVKDGDVIPDIIAPTYTDIRWLKSVCDRRFNNTRSAGNHIPGGVYNKIRAACRNWNNNPTSSNVYHWPLYGNSCGQRWAGNNSQKSSGVGGGYSYHLVNNPFNFVTDKDAATGLADNTQTSGSAIKLLKITQTFNYDESSGAKKSGFNFGVPEFDDEFLHANEIKVETPLITSDFTTSSQHHWFAGLDGKENRSFCANMDDVASAVETTTLKLARFRGGAGCQSISNDIRSEVPIGKNGMEETVFSSTTYNSTEELQLREVNPFCYPGIHWEYIAYEEEFDEVIEVMTLPTTTQIQQSKVLKDASKLEYQTNPTVSEDTKFYNGNNSRIIERIQEDLI